MLALAAFVMPSTAQAMSSTCKNASDLTSRIFELPVNQDLTYGDHQNLAVEKGEKFSLTFNNLGNSRLDLTITSAVFSIPSSVTIPGNQSKQVLFTAISDSSAAEFVLRRNSADSPARMSNDDEGKFQISRARCNPATGVSYESETTSKGVTSAVARSQTTVIQQNTGARVATVIGSAGAGTTGSTGGNNGTGTNGSGNAGTGQDGVVDDKNSFTQAGTQAGFATPFGTRNDNNRDSRDVMRRLALSSSFDSSVMAADFARDHALALGPTDQGTVGGASGVDGRSALANASPITIWGHGSYTSVDNDYAQGTIDNTYDGDVWGYNIGADYRFANNVVAGLSLGYNDTDLTTSFNDGTYQENAWVISPYAIFSPVQNLSLIAEGGYSQGDIDVTRNNDAVNGKTESALWYASVKGIYAYRPIADTPLTLSPSVSLLASRKTIDSYTESDGTFIESSRSNTRQIKPSLEAAYDFGFNTLTITPFVETGLVYDFTDELNNDKTAFNIGGGVRMSDRSTGFNAALEASYLAGRTDYTEYTIAGTISYGFDLRTENGQSFGVMTPFFGSDVDEYGNQSMTGGLGFDAGPMTSRLSLAHDIAQNSNADSSVQLSMSVPF